MRISPSLPVTRVAASEVGLEDGRPVVGGIEAHAQQEPEAGESLLHLPEGLGSEVLQGVEILPSLPREVVDGPDASAEERPLCAGREAEGGDGPGEGSNKAGGLASLPPLGHRPGQVGLHRLGDDRGHVPAVGGVELEGLPEGAGQGDGYRDGGSRRGVRRGGKEHRGLLRTGGTRKRNCVRWGVGRDHTPKGGTCPERRAGWPRGRAGHGIGYFPISPASIGPWVK